MSYCSPLSKILKHEMEAGIMYGTIEIRGSEIGVLGGANTEDHSIFAVGLRFPLCMETPSSSRLSQQQSPSGAP